MRSLGEILGLGVQYLKDKQIHSPRLTAELLLAHLLQKKRMDLYMNFECPLEEDELARFRVLLKRASLGEPVEYIIGSVEFYGACIEVSKQVLIPRPETEILVDKMAKILEKEDLEGKVLLDVCAGSGCIGLSLKKKFPKLSVFLSDVSEGALGVCRQNAKRNELTVDFLQGDLLTPFQGRKANYFVCNPPYVTRGEYDTLDSSVKDFEPALALVGGETGLEFYERLEKELPPYLEKGAKVFLEIGAGQGEALMKIFTSSFWKKKELFSDFAGHDRFFLLEVE